MLDLITNSMTVLGGALGACPGRLQPDRLNRSGSRAVLPTPSRDHAWRARDPSDSPERNPSVIQQHPSVPKGLAVTNQHPRVVYTLAAERQRDLRAQAMRAHLKQLALLAQRPPKSRAP